MPAEVSAFAIDIFRLGVWLVLLVIVFVPLERLFALHPARLLRPQVATDLGYFFVSSLVPGLLLGVPMAVVAWAVHAVMPAGLQTWASDLPLAARLGASLVVGEIGFYWGHRLAHSVPLLWRFHAVHHSAEHLDWLVNTRAHPVDMVFTRLCGLVPLYALGLAQPLSGRVDLVPLIVVIAGTFWGFFIHANLRVRFGWLEHLVATPAFHHWHHSRRDHVDRNFASMLPWVDRLFGTHHLPREWPTEYGTDTPIPRGLVPQLLAPVRQPL